MSEPGTKCPRCGAESPCTDYDEVDVGIGVIRGNHQFTCPTCGPFCFKEYKREDGKIEQRALYQDEAIGEVALPHLAAITPSELEV